MVWLPSVTISNSNDDRNAMIKSIAGVQIFPDGTTSWWPDIATKTSCQISVQKYPFDKQKCELELAAWLRNTREQQFRVSKNEITMASQELNTEWEFIRSSVEVEMIGHASLSSVKISIEVKRNAFYQIVHTLIPIVLLSYMNCFIFIIPINSGENTSFGVAIFLAFAVFIGPVKESLPVTSTETCILTVYMIAQFCVGGLETCLSCITLSLATRTTRVRTNSWWNKIKDIASFLKSRERKVSPELLSAEPQIMIEQVTNEEIGNKAKTQVISTIATPHPDVVLTEHMESSGSPSVSVDWTTVGSNLNVLLFIFFIFVKTILLIMFLIMVAS
ncbi:acetylcholine receptor subunit delta-like [Argopecten irradians]|uniref:acetylcholine receptor subunit delta-like n=1 Tax=Argopecten irradians TaxID=31199 RepID=UPI00372260B5